MNTLLFGIWDDIQETVLVIGILWIIFLKIEEDLPVLEVFQYKGSTVFDHGNQAPKSLA